VKGAQQVLNTITNQIDQNIYMQRFAERLSGSPTCAQLPGCRIIDRDNDGSPEVIQAKNITIAKVVTPEGNRLQATDATPGIVDRISDAASQALTDAKAGIRAWWKDTRLGDALGRATTSDSESNRRWNRMIYDAERPRHNEVQ
jgi:hypothetical protein